MPRKPQQDRSKATVAAIIEAGLTVLAREGPNATSTRRIAEVAGISVGSLYEYFKDREAIHAAMAQRLAADAADVIQPLIPELVRMSVREAMGKILHRARQFLEQDDGRNLQCVRHMPSLSQDSLAPLRRVLAQLAMQYLTHHPELARARNLPAMSYIIIYGAMASMIRYLTEEAPAIRYEDLAQALTDMVDFSIQGSLHSTDVPARR